MNYFSVMAKVGTTGSPGTLHLFQNMPRDLKVRTLEIDTGILYMLGNSDLFLEEGCFIVSATTISLQLPVEFGIDFNKSFGQSKSKQLDSYPSHVRLYHR